HQPGHVQRRQLHGLQGPGGDVDLHLAEDAAEDRGGGQPLDGGQLVVQLVVGEVEEVLVVAAAAGDDEVADGDAAGVVLENAGRQRGRGQVLELAPEQGDDLAGGQVGVHLREEADLDDADAEQRARLDVVEVVAARQGAFEHGRDGLLHVRGR